MKKILITFLLSACCLAGCGSSKTKTHIYCYRSDSGWCDECEHYSEMDLTKDNIISFNMTVMPFPDIYETGVRHYHYFVVEVI